MMALGGLTVKAGRLGCPAGSSRLYYKESLLPQGRGRSRVRGSGRGGIALGLINQILLVRQLCRPAIQPEVVAAGCLQPFMSENFLDVANWAAVEQQLGSRRVSTMPHAA